MIGPWARDDLGDIDALAADIGVRGRRDAPGRSRAICGECGLGGVDAQKGEAMSSPSRQGISRRMVAYYEQGNRAIPRVVALATRGLELG